MCVTACFSSVVWFPAWRSYDNTNIERENHAFLPHVLVFRFSGQTRAWIGIQICIAPASP